MAKIRYGGMVGTASGSVASTVYSRNRYGAYTRNRTKPITVDNVYTLAAKSRFTECSQAWAGLTDAQRLAWSNWAGSNPITDVLGDKQTLTGHAAYVQINARLLVAGIAKLSDPPLVVAPAPLATVTGSFDIGAGSFQVAYTATPLAAGCRLWVQAAVVNNPSIVYVKDKLRFVGVSAAVAASPYALDVTIPARLGAVTVGQKVVVLASVFDGATGLLSPPLRTEGVVTST